MKKLFACAAVLCAALTAVIAVCAIRAASGEKVESRDRAPDGRLHRRIRAGKSIEEIRRIAKQEARREVERVARQKKSDAEAEARRTAEEQKRLREEACRQLKEEWQSLKPEERQLLDELNEAMCGDDLKTVSFAAEEFARHPNPVVRRAVVEAVSWFGDQGLPDLAVFLVDQDEDVATLAKERWSLGVEEVEDDQEKVTLSKLGMLYVKDEDSLTTFMGDLTTVGDNLMVMQALVDLIEAGTPESAAVAREQYEWMTGDEWTTIEAADAWLQDNMDD